MSKSLKNAFFAGWTLAFFGGLGCGWLSDPVSIRGFPLFVVALGIGYFTAANVAQFSPDPVRLSSRAIASLATFLGIVMGFFSYTQEIKVSHVLIFGLAALPSLWIPPPRLFLKAGVEEEASPEPGRLPITADSGAKITIPVLKAKQLEIPRKEWIINLSPDLAEFSCTNTGYKFSIRKQQAATLIKFSSAFSSYNVVVKDDPKKFKLLLPEGDLLWLKTWIKNTEIQ